MLKGESERQGKMNEKKKDRETERTKKRKTGQNRIGREKASEIG